MGDAQPFRKGTNQDGRQAPQVRVPYYEVHGRKGHPLILLPGFATDLQSWIFQRDEFAREHRLLLMDPFGTGRSQGPPFSSTTLGMAEEVLRVIDAAGVEQVDLLGHSLGGAVAQELALLAPDRIRKLLLISTFCRGSELPSHLLRCWQSALRPIDDHLMTSEVLPWLYSDTYLRLPNRLKSILGFLRANRFPPSQEGLTAQIAAIESHDCRDRLSRITKPTLVAVGSLDRLTPPQEARRLSLALPNARYLEIPEAAHVVMIEQPDTFRQIVLEFLR